MTFSSGPGSGFDDRARLDAAGARRLGAARAGGRAPGPGVKPACRRRRNRASSRRPRVPWRQPPRTYTHGRPSVPDRKEQAW